MTTQGPQKAVLAEDQLPPVTVFDDGSIGYTVRYRFVSEDRNRFSSYSPNYFVKTNYVYERPNGIAESGIGIDRVGPYVQAVWEPVLVKDRVSGSIIKTQDQYDVYFSWSQQESNRVWIESERYEDPMVGYRIPSSYETDDGDGTTTTVASEPTHFSIEVYVRSTNRSQSNTQLLVYKAVDVDITKATAPPNI